jgi:hypothetical protein
MTKDERRYICRLIDVAVESCELANLREELEVPRGIVDLVVHLQAASGEPLSVPQDTIVAHGQLLDLRQGYMNCQREQGNPGRPCDCCGAPLSAVSRHTTCPRCRHMRRLVARVAKAMAS